MIAKSQNASAVVKPCVEGEDARRWYCEKSGRWLILFPNGATRAKSVATDEATAWNWVKSTYPSIAEHLAQFETQARKRQDQGEFWWELRPCDYVGDFEKPKIIYPDIAKSMRFSMDLTGVRGWSEDGFVSVGGFLFVGRFTPYNQAC